MRGRGTRLVSGAKLAPQGRLRKAQGASPGNKHSKQGKPRRGDAVGPGTKEAPYDEHLSGVETKLPAPPFSGLSAIRTLNPGLAPWAVLLDPFGVLGFATETRLVSGAKLAPQGRLRKAQGASPGNKHSNNGSPEGAMQLVPVPKRFLMTSSYLELKSNSLRRPFRAFRNPNFEPRARALGLSCWTPSGSLVSRQKLG